MNERLTLNRRTAMKMTGAGLAGSVLFSGGAAAGGRKDASVILVDSNFAGPGGFDDFGNVTSDGAGNELELGGAVIFDKKDDTEPIGGGTFSLEGPSVTDTDGTWTASEVVRFERYGAFPTSVAPLPRSWKGGLVELVVDLGQEIPGEDGVEAGDTLTIECGVGTHDSDEPELGSGFFIGDYTDVEMAFNLFTY